jgi:regulator of sirC expression with transglutaminase-like and TPR domain
VSVPATADLSRRLRELTGRDQPDLFEGALLISALIDPAEDLGAARQAVAALARRVRRQADETGEPAHLALQRVLFTEEGFRGDEESYDDPANSSVARVIARRRGMPITLSIVAIEVGRLAGLRLNGIGLPGHFVVGGPDLPEGSFLDAFDGGRIYDTEGLSRRIGTIFGSPVALSPDLLAADPARAILARVLLNLRRSLERRSLWDAALAALDLSQTLEPDSPDLRRERGLVLLKCGRMQEAVAALEAYTASSEGEDADAVRKLLGVIRERGEEEAEGEEPGSAEAPEKKIFTLEEARALMPRVRAITEEAVSRYGRLGDRLEEERQSILREWAREIQALGAEIKGLWLVDFDSGAGYYCWKYPEPALDHFHGYEEGFAGRLPLQ